MRKIRALVPPEIERAFRSRPLRVLMTADTVGGVWTYALDLARALEPAEVHIDLATMGALLSPAQQSEADSLGNLVIHPSSYKLEWMDSPWEDVEAAGDWLLDLEDRLRPDIVHLNGYAHGALPFRAPILMVGHSCVCSWWQAVRGHAAPDCERYIQAARKGLQAAHLVLTPTQAMLKSLDDFYGPLSSCGVVANGRDGHLFASKKEKKKEDKEPFILTVGRLWDEAKNIGMLDYIAAKIPWPIYVAGEAQHPCGGHREVDSVKPLGHLSPFELADWFRRASIYALPARYEPFGLSALEAALSGCALVLGDIPSLREVWGDAALFVPPNDAAALQNTLETLIADPMQRAEFARRATERARRYDLEQMAEGYLKAYESLLPAQHQHRGRHLLCGS